MKMSEVGRLAPPAFRFKPAGAHDSPAFTPLFKGFSTTVVLLSAIWFATLWWQGALGPSTSSGITWFVTGLLLMLYTLWHILRSRTRLDDRALHQAWIWDKHVELEQLVYGKMIRVRGLEWLIAPRLYVRTLTGKFSVFYAADPALLADFERLVQDLEGLRRAQ